MGKILVIAEKPSVARDIAKVLQAKQKGEGCLIGERYVVSWAVGHLVTLVEPNMTRNTRNGIFPRCRFFLRKCS